MQALHLLKSNRFWPGSLFYVVVFHFTHTFLDNENVKKIVSLLPLINLSLRGKTHKKTMQSGKYHDGSFQKETKIPQGEKSFRRLHMNGDS